MYAGIDFDTRAVHVVLLPDEGPARYLPFVMHGHDAFERTRAVRDVMPARGCWEDEGVIAIGIEEPMGRGSVVQKLNVVQGAILSCLPRSLLVNPMRPSVWRTAVGMPGNASKDDVAAFALDAMSAFWREAVREDYWPQDAYDAWCMARAVQKLTEPVAA